MRKSIVDSTKQVIAKNVRLRRESLDMTQAQLAEAADLSQVSIQTLEAGKTIPRESSLEKIAKVLGWQVFQLFMPDPEALSPKPSPSIQALAKVVSDQQDEIDRLEAMIAGCPRDIIEALARADSVDIELVRNALGLNPEAVEAYRSSKGS